MDKLEKVINAIEEWLNDDNAFNTEIDACLVADALELLKDQQPRLLTLEEVINHYFVPEEIRHDADKRVDYQNDIAPLYWELRFYTDKDLGHWRGYNTVNNYVKEYVNDYGILWRCWTAKPTEEQRNAVPWKDGDGE